MSITPLTTALIATGGRRLRCTADGPDSETGKWTGQITLGGAVLAEITAKFDTKGEAIRAARLALKQIREMA